MSSPLVCSTCGSNNPPEALHCARCGAKLAANCPSCGLPNVAEAQFCVQCGTRLQKEPARSTAAGAFTPPVIENQPPKKKGSIVPALLLSCLGLALCVAGIAIVGLLVLPRIDLLDGSLPAIANPATPTPYNTWAPSSTKKPTLTATLTATIPAKHAPVITEIDFPSHIPGNATDQKGSIKFTDLGSDVILAKFTVIRGKFNGFSFDPTGSISGDPRTGAKIPFTIWCDGKQSTITLSVTLKDAAGFTSPAVQFTFACT